MSRCPRTAAVLEAAFAASLGAEEADHAAGCPQCARALAAARRFDRELHAAGAELSPELMPVPEDVMVVSDSSEPRFGRGQRRLAAGIAGGAALVAAFFIGGQWLGEAAGPMLDAEGGGLRGVGDAAALIGAAPNSVLVTEDGVVGIRDLGDRLELVLVRSSESRGLEEFVVDTVQERQISVLGCTDDGFLRAGYVWGSWPGVLGIEGVGDFVVTNGELVLSTFDPGSDMRSVTLVERGERMTEISFSRVDSGECVLPPHADARPVDPLPEMVDCAEWQTLDDVAQLAVTEGVIFEWLMPAVRAREELPEASADDVIRAARSSIDKGCQDPANATAAVSDVAVRLYGR